MDLAGDMFTEIKQTKGPNLEDRVKCQLDAYTMAIYKEIKGKINVRFVIDVPGCETPFKYKIGNGEDHFIQIHVGKKTRVELLSGYIENVKHHMWKHSMHYIIIIPIVLLLAGYNTTDVIKVIHVFDTQVTSRIYEVVSILVNRTDSAH